MKELASTLRLACYICALPLIVTAVASASHWMVAQDDTLPTQDVAVAEEVKAPATVVAIEDTRTHVFTIDDNGNVAGRIAIVDELTGQSIGAQDVEITFNYRGEVKGAATTDSEGVFSVAGMRPGAYTFIARNDDALAAVGVYVEESASNPPPANEIQLQMIAVGTSLGTVRDLLNAPISAEVPEGGGELVKASDVGFPMVIGTNRVSLTADGNVVGRVAPLEWDPDAPLDLRGNMVYLVKDNQVVTEASVNALGQFELVGVQPGAYEFVSAGPHGSAAFCLDVVANSADDLNAMLGLPPMLLGIGMNPVPTTITAQTTCDTVLTEPNAVGVPAPLAQPAPLIVVITSGGGAAGGGAGCCGGGGGSGGFGGDWLGAALGAAILLYALDQLDGNNRPFIPPIPPPISPVRP